MTDRELLQQAFNYIDCEGDSSTSDLRDALHARLLQPEQKPMAFKIYLPTAPSQQVNQAKLPWVYDQDRSSGNVASMWVTPVATLPAAQPVPLTDEQIEDICNTTLSVYSFARAIEAAHSIGSKP